MAGRSKRVLNSAPNLEHEIERNREQEEWEKVSSLADQLKKRVNDKQIETLGFFLTGEAKLEQYLDEHPPKESNCQDAKNGLHDAKVDLLRATGDDAKKLGVHLDSFILLGKLNFAQGQYSEALSFYEKAQLETLEEKHLPPRSLKIMAEAFAIKAMCTEKLPPPTSSKTRRTEREDNIVRFYELAGDLTLLFLQQADRTAASGQSTWSVTSVGTTATTGSSSPVPTPDYRPKMGPILEAALYKAPMLYVKAGKYGKAIARYRSMLLAEETESTKEIRRNICCKLAETLLYGCSEGKYTKPEIESSAKRLKAPYSTLSSGPLTSSAESPWKPKRHSGGANAFVPKNKYEELILILLLSDYIASKDAVLSQNSQLQSLRKSRYEFATTTYDLLTLTLARFFNFRLLSDSLERSMKFSFNEKHTWQQFVYVLACEGNFYRSLLVFREMFDIHKELDVGTFLCMARFCYEKLGFYQEGQNLSRMALTSEAAKARPWLSARCHVYIAVGFSLLIRNVESRIERRKMSLKAEKHLKAAEDLDPFDYLVKYYLALHYAVARQIDLAFKYVRRTLQLLPDHLPSLQLMVLLLTSKHEYEKALQLTEQTLDEYPENLSLMTLKVRLQEIIEGPESALNTAKDMLQQWHTFVEQMHSDDQSLAVDGMTNCSIGGAITPINMINSASMMGPSNEVISYGTLRSTGGQMFDALSDKDSISLHAHSVSASHVEKTLSEIASSMSSQLLRVNNSDPMYSLMRIWLLTAELHLRVGNLDGAELCANEARSWSPICYHLTYVRGLIHEARGQFEEARQCYENTLSVNPTHLCSLYHLGRVYYQLGFYRLSEQTLKMALRIEPGAEDIWSRLGVVTEALASDFFTVHDEQTSSLTDEVPKETSSGEVDFSCANVCSPIHSPVYEDEALCTPTVETTNRLRDEATKQFSYSAKCQAIALTMHATTPILPFSTIPITFE